MSKQDRQPVRTASELEQKYKFGKQYAEIMGIALDTRDHVDSVESDLRSEISEASTSITRSAEEIILEALKSYAKKDELGELETKLETSFGVRAEGIEGRVTKAETSIQEVDGDLQEKFNVLSKYFTFDINGLEIGATYTDENGEEKKSPNKVTIDNDDITISVKEKPVLVLKADGSSIIPSLDVTTSLNVVGLNISEDDTHINCGYVG